MQGEDELKATSGRWKRVAFRHIRWLTRVPVLLVVVLVIIHRVYPPLIEWLAEFVGLNPIQAITIATLIISVIMLERVIVIEELQIRPLYQIYATREHAYDELSAFLMDRDIKISHLDLLQFSGHTAGRFLTEMAKRWPKAKIRLLLIHPEIAANFDKGSVVDHCARIKGTLSHIKMLSEDHPDFKVDLGYYRTPPGLAAIVGERFVNVGWYRCYKDHANQKIIGLRGHNLPAITAVDGEAAILQSFAKSHFEQLWAAKEA